MKVKVEKFTKLSNKIVAKAAKPPKMKKTTAKIRTKSWNDMSHLFLKRFADDDPALTAGAKRDRKKHPHLVIAEHDPSGRAKCKLCGDRIAKSELRFTLFLECHKGYRNPCTLHDGCFWKHPESSKVTAMEEIHMAATLSRESRKLIAKAFQGSRT